MYKLSSSFERRKSPQRWESVQRLVESGFFSIAIAILIIVSISLIFAETFWNLSDTLSASFERTNQIITIIFIIELFLRWLASPSTAVFISAFWVDLLAVMPALRVFRIFRVFRILRVFRLISISAHFQRRFAIFSRVLHGQYLELSVILAFIIVSVVFGTLGFSQYEQGHGAIHSKGDAFWKALFSLLSGEYADYPETLGGKIISIVLLLFGMGVFAMLTGTFSALMIEKFKENAMHNINNFDDLKNHIIICGFNSKVPVVIAEFLLDPSYKGKDIVIVSENANLEFLENKGVKVDRISIVKDDFTKVEALRKAGVEKAMVAVILSETGDRTTHDIDARSILAALTIETMNKNIHTSVELFHEEYVDHLRLGGVEDIVVQGEISGRLLAKVAMQEGMLTFFEDLLTRGEGNTIFFKPVPQEYVGQSFSNSIGDMHKKSNLIIVGIKRKDQELIVNPRELLLEKDDMLLVISPVNYQGGLG